MAKDPVCGMFVEEKPDSIRYTMNGKEYFFFIPPSIICWNKMAEVKIHEIEKNKVSSTCNCVVGSAADQILRFAKTNKIDIIIMASRRFKGISKIRALGSVTRKVSELADCPVLIIH